MPLSQDDQVNKTAQDLVNQLQSVFGKHSGCRPAHAKGILLHGSFSPTSEAKELTNAPHFHNPSTPVIVRFSSSTGLPQIPDTDPNSEPRGIAVRFDLGGRKHTDVIAHSTPFFPSRTGADFLAFFQHIAAGTVGEYLGKHPSALAFIQAPKPTPASLAQDTYFGVNAFKFINAEGKKTYFRYEVVPDAHKVTLDEAALKLKGANFLYEEIVERVGKGPVTFSLLAQIAKEGDQTDDATVHWPESREKVKLGTVKLESVVPEAEQQKEQKHLIFDPIPRVQGIEPSADPLLDMRAAVYLLSGRERRAAAEVKVSNGVDPSPGVKAVT